MGFLDLSAESSPEVALHPKPLIADAQGQASGERYAQDEEKDKAGESKKNDPAVFVSKHVSALQTVEGFLDALTNANRCSEISADWRWGGERVTVWRIGTCK